MPRISDSRCLQPLDDYVRQRISDGARGLGATGLRGEPSPSHHLSSPWLFFIRQLVLASVLAMARGDTMQSLMLVGMVGMLDPPRLGAAEAISMVQASGVDVKLITGDAQETAQSIGSTTFDAALPLRLAAGVEPIVRSFQRPCWVCTARRTTAAFLDRRSTP